MAASHTTGERGARYTLQAVFVAIGRHGRRWKQSVQCKVRLGDGGVVRNATKATCNLLATALPVGTHAAVRDGKAVTQAVGACDVELSNHVWRRPPRAHGMGVVLLYRR